MIDVKKIKEILKTETGKDIQEFIKAHYNRLKSIENIKDLDNLDEIAIEVKAHKKALRIVGDMLCEIIEIRESEIREETAEEDKYY